MKTEAGIGARRGVGGTSADAAPGGYQSILVAIDPYQLGTGVLDRAVALGLRYCAQLTLVSVVPAPSTWVWFVPWLPFDPRRELEADCAESLRAAARIAPKSLPVVTLLRHGSPARVLLAQLRDGAHDLVVLGTSERRSISIARSGRTQRRTMRRILRHSPVPILIVGDAADAPHDELCVPAPLGRPITQGA